MPDDSWQLVEGIDVDVVVGLMDVEATRPPPPGAPHALEHFHHQVCPPSTLHFGHRPITSQCDGFKKIAQLSVCCVYYFFLKGIHVFFFFALHTCLYSTVQ